MKNGTLRLFISYAHEDEPFRSDLEAHLSPLQHRGLITNWSDRRIAPGTDWNQEISTNLEAADIVVLLVSSHFVASTYCYGREMQLALSLHDSGALNVVPVITRACRWEQLPFGRLQALPGVGQKLEEGLILKRWPSATLSSEVVVVERS